MPAQILDLPQVEASRAHLDQLLLNLIHLVLGGHEHEVMEDDS